VSRCREAGRNRNRNRNRHRRTVEPSVEAVTTRSEPARTAMALVTVLEVAPIREAHARAAAPSWKSR
jgi:hypothetical protein